MEKIYCGNAKIINTQYGEMTKISFHKDDINKMVAHIKSEGSDWINLVLKEKKEPKEGKPTHYLEVDTWKPENRPEPQPEQYQSNEEEDDLPF